VTIEEYQGQPVLRFPTERAFEKWLSTEHRRSSGVWLKLAKKGCPEPSVTYAEALDVALCFGWIDGQKRPLDELYWLQRFTPRTARSKWSKINCGKVEVLVTAGRMRPAGLREVELAKADGRWEAAYAGQSSATIPDDLQRALDANKKAAAFFATLDSGNRYAILYRVQEAKRPETRARRIEKFIEMLENGETVHPRPTGRPAQQ
jgi:uncharacterized protein YdeI (YjbR/CyaY-like superfamily)